VYFVHSVAADPADPACTIARVDYAGTPVTAAVGQGPIAACQFHPEKSGAVGETMLRRWLEQLVHPLVSERISAELERLAAEPTVVVVIPLLFETRGGREFDLVIVVSAPAAVQRARVLARPGMTPERLSAILARQMPDAEKRRRADVLVRTGLSRHHADQAIRRIIRECRA
jgi:dephospho-CoA kinase